MDERIRVMVQYQPTPLMAAAASFGARAAAPATSLAAMPGLEIDHDYAPVPVPRRTPPAGRRAAIAVAAAPRPAQPSGYLTRAAVSAEALPELLERADADPTVVGIFADPRIEPVGVCPTGPVGTDQDLERLLLVDELRRRGMDGAGVKVVIVDSGVNLSHLRVRGKTPGFDAELSWGPVANQTLGEMPVGHGTMCGFDVCIAAPACTLVDHSLLTSPTRGGSTMDGYLSDAVKSYGLLLNYMTRPPSPFAGDQLPRTLVVNNSWAMFHESWDFPVGDPQNYSDNPDHPFNIIVESLEDAGADILFCAGNCGAECPDGRCRGVSDAGITGANSSPAVLSVAGVVTSKERIGYSSQGPGRIETRKPDVACYTHFAGSGVYPADGGTSAATPVAAGVVAAIRRVYPSSLLSPHDLRQLLRETADQRGPDIFNDDYGYGVLDVKGLLAALDSMGLQSVAGAPAAKPKTKKKKRKKKSAEN